jgi:hypothetical protein
MMDRQDNVEVHDTEGTPLLGDRALLEQPASERGTAESRSRGIAKRILWILAIAIILGVFIKGWIDAGGDVHVSNAYWRNFLASD